MSPRRIGVIGKATLTADETTKLTYLGRCIARLGHTLVATDAAGFTAAVKSGVEREGGQLVAVGRAVIDAADHTLVYPDDKLLGRLERAYPDLHTRSDVLVVRSEQLDEWLDAVLTVMRERGVDPPS